MTAAFNIRRNFILLIWFISGVAVVVALLFFVDFGEHA